MTDTPDTSTEAVERLAMYMRRGALPIPSYNARKIADALRALAAERDMLTARVAEMEAALTARDNRIRAEAMREAAGMIETLPINGATILVKSALIVRAEELEGRADK